MDRGWMIAGHRSPKGVRTMTTANTTGNLSAATRINALLTEYPFLLETIASHAPELGKLRNPLLRRTFGRLATLGDAARLGGVSLASLLDRVSAEIERQTGRRAQVGDAGAGSGAGAPAAAGDYRVDELKGMLRELHRGTPPEQLRDRFARLLERVSATEIAEAEQQLVAEGLPETEIKRLCDVHAAVFRGEAQQTELALPDDNPLRALQRENRELLAAVDGLRAAWAAAGPHPTREAFENLRGELELALGRMEAAEKHYAHKENRIFPLLERHGVEAPPKVMWAVHDDVRALLRQGRAAIIDGDIVQAGKVIPELTRVVADMVTKEEQILFPLCMEVFDAGDWRDLATAGDELATEYAARSVATDGAAATSPEAGDGQVALPVGAMTVAQLGLLFCNLPVDITYVDQDDRVRFYSEGKRIFPREPQIIGRKVQNCHPQKSVHVVEEILRQFRAGRRDVAEFWLDYRGQFVYIQYIALRDADGAYQGVLEVAQDATRVRGLAGQRRLLEWE
jgi:DUF438 domain-containing protein